MSTSPIIEAVNSKFIIGDDGDLEKLCEHGVGHGAHVHTCDGCCTKDGFYKFPQRIFSGMCVCGHSWEDHHLGMVVNVEAAKEHRIRREPPYVAQECEYYGCNEWGGLDEDGNMHCGSYLDVDDPRRDEKDDG